MHKAAVRSEAVLHNVASTLELTPLLGLILDQLKWVVDYTGAAIFTIDEEQARVVDYRGPLPRHEVLKFRVPSSQALGYQAVSYAKGPVIVDDAWFTHPLAQSIGDLRAYFSSMVAYACSWLVVPLMIQERVFGVVRIDHAAACAYTAHHAALARELEGRSPSKSSWWGAEAAKPPPHPTKKFSC